MSLPLMSATGISAQFRAHSGYINNCSRVPALISNSAAKLITIRNSEALKSLCCSLEEEYFPISRTQEVLLLVILVPADRQPPPNCLGPKPYYNPRPTKRLNCVGGTYTISQCNIARLSSEPLQVLAQTCSHNHDRKSTNNAYSF